MKKIIIYIICFVISLFVGSFGMYYYITKNPAKFKEIVTKSEKSVTIDDKGISEAVSKIYDAVVTVNTYKGGTSFASGTGFVYKKGNEESYILTNAHVIKNADEVYVTFTNGTNEKAKIIGQYTIADIAVLSVSNDKIISTVEIGSSKNANIGDTVFTVGAPLGDAYSWSVTRGILSGKERLVEVSDDNRTNSSNTYIMNVIQTDAAINSGNSGGPLANSNGEVIGITSLKLVTSGVEGMGFAIPIETAIKYADKIINNEDIITPYIGVSMLNINEAYYYQEFTDIVKNSNLDNGVVITSVENNSPALKSGLRKGDIIIKINDKKCPSIAYVRYLLTTHEVGEKIKVTYLRNNEEKTALITLSNNKA